MIKETDDNGGNIGREIYILTSCGRNNETNKKVIVQSKILLKF